MKRNNITQPGHGTYYCKLTRCESACEETWKQGCDIFRGACICTAGAYVIVQERVAFYRKHVSLQGAAELEDWSVCGQLDRGFLSIHTNIRTLGVENELYRTSCTGIGV